MSAADTLCLIMHVYTFFGVTLAVAPVTCWGPGSPLQYWSVFDDSGQFFARGLGVCMATMTLSPYTTNIDKLDLAKMYLPMNIVFLGLFAWAAFVLETTGPGHNAMIPGLNLWIPQVVIGTMALLLNFQALTSTPKAKSK